MCSSEQIAESMALEVRKSACFGRIEMPWENLQVAADRGLLFTGLKRHDSSLGYVSAIVMVSDEMYNDNQIGLMNLHCRYGEDLYRIPDDLSQRSDEQLLGDEVFCEWQIAARGGVSGKAEEELRNQEAARWNFRIIKTEPEELDHFIEALVRIKAEMARRVKLSNSAAADPTAASASAKRRKSRSVAR